MSKFKLTQTATEVQDILNNSLQKPTGLTKTKLVGVGVNGQENIEIGDNLTLANGKLSATGGGSSGSNRHCYYVDVDGQFIYIVHTEKNYNFKIGQQNTVSNFMTNPDFAELHAGGGDSFHDYRYYPAIGTYKGSRGETRIVRAIGLYSNQSGQVLGKSLDSSITTDATPIDLTDIVKYFSIVKLY